MEDAILFSICLLLGGTGAWFISKCGGNLNLLDVATARSSHDGVVPKGGGIGIMIAFLISSIVLSVPNSFWIPAVLLSLVSLWGDRFEIRPVTRLLLQLVAAVLLLLGALLADYEVVAMYALVPLLLIFIVGTANCYNFMDGINGIAAITGIVGFGLLAFYASGSESNHNLKILSICMSLSCLGFLPFNMPKAKVFMGDVGSILIGFVFAAMIVLLSRSIIDFVCFAGLLFPFYADEFTTLIVRIKDGDSLTKPHRKHFYQILANEKGIPHWKISVAFGLFQMIVGMSVFVAKSSGYIMVFLVLTGYLAGFSWLTYSVRKKLEQSAFTV